LGHISGLLWLQPHVTVCHSLCHSMSQLGVTAWRSNLTG
jgi:hypothetical protein